MTQPWRILHRAGESPGGLHRGRAVGADLLEIDLRLHPDGQRVDLRHDPLLAGIPWLTVRHHLPRLRWRRMTVGHIPPGSRLFLDFKEEGEALVDRTLAALATANLLPGAAASTPWWASLDYLATRAPDIERFYSLGRDDASRWPEYQRRMERGEGGHGVSIHRDLATPERLRALVDADLRAIVYPVNDFALGKRLLEQGAGGLTTDDAGLIRRWRE